MPRRTVRNVNEQVVRALKRRVAHRGRSAEAGHRDILRKTSLGAPGPSSPTPSSAPCPSFLSPASPPAFPIPRATFEDHPETANIRCLRSYFSAYGLHPFFLRQKTSWGESQKWNNYLLWVVPSFP